MQKVSKVKEVSVLDSWTKDGDQYWPHRYIMEDGTQITANHKSLNPFAVGAEVGYEVKGNDPKGNPKGSVGKVQTNPSNGSGSPQTKSWVAPDQDAILFQVALKGACELIAKDVTTKLPSAESLVDYAFDIAKLSKVKIAELKTV